MWHNADDPCIRHSMITLLRMRRVCLNLAMLRAVQRSFDCSASDELKGRSWRCPCPGKERKDLQNEARNTLQGSWSTHGALWIAMEYCGGGSVADLVHAADGPLEQPIIAYLCAETLSGLKYLHSIGKVRFAFQAESGQVQLAHAHSGPPVL